MFLFVTCIILSAVIVVIQLGTLILLPPIAVHFEKVLVTTRLDVWLLSGQLYVGPLLGLLDILLGSKLRKRGKSKGILRITAILGILIGILGVLGALAWWLAFSGAFGHFTLGG